MYWLANSPYWAAEERDGEIRSRATVQRLSKSYRVHVVTDCGYVLPVGADPAGTHTLDLRHYHIIRDLDLDVAKRWAEEEIARQLRIMKQWREES